MLSSIDRGIYKVSAWVDFQVGNLSKSYMGIALILELGEGALQRPSCVISIFFDSWGISFVRVMLPRAVAMTRPR